MNFLSRLVPLPGITLALTAIPMASAANEPGAASARQDSKPYVLFMRTDVAVAKNKQLYPVKDVSGRDFIVAVNGSLQSVPTVGSSSSIEFKHALTLARASASLTGLVFERAYTPANDPRMRRQRDAMKSEAAVGDTSALAEGQFISAENKSYSSINIDARAPDGTLIHGVDISAAQLDGIAEANATKAFQEQTQAETMRQSNVTSGAFARLAADNDLTQEMFDAVSVRFTVSSDTYLEKPYLVVITRFHTREDRPGMARNSIYARALEPIGQKPSSIDVLQGGMPAGFELENVQVHLYDNGREIPTEVSPKRVPLSRDEAFEYLKIEYLSGHKGDTLVATPALGRPTKEQRLQLTPNQWKANYYAKVSKEGVPTATFADEACTEPVEGLLGELVNSVRYYPALEKGRQVEGTARLSLRELPL